MTIQHEEKNPQRILIVEPAASLAMDLAQSLTGCGYEVVGTASTAGEAVRQALESKPDLILMDVTLPDERDGIAAYAEIRGRLDIPVVYLTGPLEAHDLERAKKTEPYGYLLKPMDLSELGRTVEAVLYKHQADRRVRESELWMKALFEGLEEAVFIVTPDRIVRDVNPAAARMFGIPRDEVVGKSTEQLHVSHDSYVEFGNRTSEAFSAGKSAFFEYALKRRNGEVFPTEHTVTLLQTASGASMGIASIVRDLTERKKAEAALRDSEETFRSVFENSPDGILLTAPDGRVIKANRAACQMLGRNEGEICEIGRGSVVDLTDPRLVSALEERGRTGSFRGELNCRRKDGTAFPVEISSSIFVSASGDLRSSMIIKDITDRKLAEEQARRLAIIVKDSNDAITVQGLDGTVLDWNLGAERTYGYKAEEALGRSIIELTVPESKRQEALGFVDAIKRGQTVAPFETERVTSDGKILDIWLTVTAIRDESGLVRGVATTERDITDSKMSDMRLQFERKQFQTLVENAPFGLVIIDEDGSFRYANPKFLDTFGYSLEEVPDGRQWFRKAFPEPCLRRQAISTWLLDLREAAPGEQRARVFTVKCKDGRDKVIHFRPVQLAEGRHLMTCEDITATWLTQERLRQSEERYRILVATTPHGIGEIDPFGTITFANDAYSRLYGYSTKEMVGKSIFDMQTSQAEADQLREYLALVRCQSLYPSPWISKERTRTGELIDVQVDWDYKRDAQGDITGFIFVITDITQRKRDENELRESEAKYRRLHETMMDAFVAVDMEGRIQETNHAYQSMLGYSDEELRQLTYLDLTPHEWQLIEARIVSEQILVKGYSDVYHKEYRRKDGTIFPAEVRTFLLKDKTGQPSGMWAIVRDISERKLLEETLRRSEEKYRLMFEFSPLGVFHFDETGTITACNDNFVRILGSSREKLIGLNTIRDSGDKAVAVSTREALSGHVGHYEGYYTSVTGFKTTPVTCNFAPILSHDDAVLGGIGIVEDITERKRAEEALRRSERLYRSVIENIIDVFYRSDAEGRLLMASPSGARLFGYNSVEDMIGLPLESLWANPEDRQKLLQIVREEGRATDYEGVLKRKDGSTFVASLSTHFYRDEDGTVLGTEGIVRDVSERKRIEAQFLQSQKMEAIGTLAGGIAHEVNNLLQVVLGHADMMLVREGIDRAFHKSLHAVRTAALNGADLVKRVLTFSRKTEPEKRAVNLTDEVRRVGEFLRRTIPRMISVEISLEEKLRMIDADPSQIEQMLLNLAANARDAMPEGGRLVIETRNTTIGEEYCRRHPEVRPGTYVLLSVSDTGQGMPKEILDRIFEPFFTTKQPGEGTGLGLSMVFGVVKSHGGHMTCHSEVGVGSAFNIYFPAFEDDPGTDRATAMEMASGGTETLLLVDDEESVRTLAAEMLELAGYSVLTAANGREALEVYRSNRDCISLVILDLVMPGMSGRKCLEELLKMNPQARVLIASGYAAEGPGKEAREGGAVGFLSKPFDLKQILSAIRRSLDTV